MISNCVADRLSVDEIGEHSGSSVSLTQCDHCDVLDAKQVNTSKALILCSIVCHKDNSLVCGDSQ